MRRDSVTSDSSMDVESSSSSRETSPSPQSDAIGAIHPHRTANQRSNSIHQQLQPSQSANDGHEGHADPISRTSHDMDMEIDQLQTNLSKLTLPKTTTKKHGHIDRPKLQPGFYRGPPMSKQNQWHNAGQANPAADATVMPVPVATSRVNTWMVPRQVNTAKPSKPSKPLRGPTFSDVHME
ncbi:hypothetical protein BGZ73_003465 [Actinomortierella ambigua]|nr:hypothetical protein BGZ73_003465 [Actinomortierella ambigua]